MIVFGVRTSMSVCPRAINPMDRSKMSASNINLSPYSGGMKRFVRWNGRLTNSKSSEEPGMQVTTVGGSMSRRRRRITRKTSYHAHVRAWLNSYYASFWFIIAAMIIMAISAMGIVPPLW